MLPRNWIAAGAGGLLGQFAQRCARMCQPSKTAKGSGTMQSVTQSKVLAVVGLGNVGNQYVGTRHNIGFAAVDEVASKLLDESGSWALEGPIWEAAHGGNLLRLKRQESNPPTESGFSELILFKPASMMNGSGLPVSQLMDALNLPETHLVLIYDDLDLEVGRLRLRKSGSAGGQNGVRSVLAQGLKISCGCGWVSPDHPRLLDAMAWWATSWDDSATRSWSKPLKLCRWRRRPLKIWQRGPVWIMS